MPEQCWIIGEWRWCSTLVAPLSPWVRWFQAQTVVWGILGEKNVPWECCVLEEGIGITPNTSFFCLFFNLSFTFQRPAKHSGSVNAVEVLCPNMSFFLQDIWGNPDCEEIFFFPHYLLFGSALDSPLCAFGPCVYVQFDWLIPLSVVSPLRGLMGK